MLSKGSCVSCFRSQRIAKKIPVTINEQSAAPITMFQFMGELSL